MAALGSNMGKKPKEVDVVKDTKKKSKASPKLSPKKVKKQPAIKAASNPPKTRKRKVEVAKSEPSAKRATIKVAPSTASKQKVVVSKKAKPDKKQPTNKVVTKPIANKSKVKVEKKLESPKSKLDVKKLRNAKLILEPSKRKKIRKTRVFLEGDLNINNVDAFISQIEPIFNDYDFVDFFNREVTSMDLCHIQMLHHFQNHPKLKSKVVTIDSDLPVELKKVIVNAGFKDLMFIPKLV